MSGSSERTSASPAAGTNQPQPAKTSKASRRYGPIPAETHMDTVNAAARSMQSDAPACNTCGHITIRSGTCYKCLNCGNSMGCS